MKNSTIILFTASILASCGGGGGGVAGRAPALTYAPHATLFLRGSEIATITPDIVGSATNFQVTPALPQGLLLDPATGTIQGTPEELSDLAWYEISATGQQIVRVRLGVAPPPRFGVVGNTADSTLSVYTIDAHNGRTGFHGYLPTPRGQDGPQDLVLHPSGRFLYVPNDGSTEGSSMFGSISIYSVDYATGRLTPLPATGVGFGPHALEMHPSGSFAYAVATGSRTLTSYVVSESSGALVATGVHSAGGAPSALALDAEAGLLYVVDAAARKVNTWNVNAQTGELSATGISHSLTGTGEPGRIELDIDGENAFLVHPDENRLEHFRIDRTTGTLQSVASVPTGLNPGPLAVHPAGSFIYVGHTGENTVTPFRFDLTTGSLEAGAAATLTERVDAITFDPAGQFLYATDRASNEFAIFEIDRVTGDLALVTLTRTRTTPVGLAISAGVDPVQLAGETLYVLNAESGDLSHFRIDVEAHTVVDLGQPMQSPSPPSRFVTDREGQYLFAAHEDGNIRVFEIEESGGLLTTPTTVPFSGQVRSLSIDPSTRYLLLATALPPRVVSYGFDAGTGDLTYLGELPVYAEPRSAQIDPTGRFVYVSHVDPDNPEDAKIFCAYRLEGGLLNPDVRVTLAPGFPRALAFSPDGARAYVALEDADTLGPYDIDAHTGELTPIPPGRPTDGSPTSIALHPSGRFAFAAVPGSGTEMGFVGAYPVNTILGHMLPGQVYTGGLQPRDLVVDPSGRLLYVANEGGDDLSVFEIDPDTGELTLLAHVGTGLRPSRLTVTKRLL